MYCYSNVPSIARKGNDMHRSTVMLLDNNIIIGPLQILYSTNGHYIGVCLCVCVCLTSRLVGGESRFCFGGRCGRWEERVGGGGAGARGRGIRVDCDDIWGSEGYLLGL